MIVSALLTAALLTTAPLAPQNPPAAPIGTQAQTDQTVPVTKGTRIDINQCSGDLVVSTWDRDAVRVRGTHSRRTRILAEVRGQVLVIETDSQAGPGSSDLELTVPAWIGLHVQGRECFVDIENVAGGVSAETVEGDITLRNLSGAVTARTIEGSIKLDTMRGRTEVSTVEGNITITKSQGEIAAESVDGSITVDNSQPTALELSTVDGDLTFSGPLAASGRYLFTTHDGDVDLVLPENTSATFGLRTSGSRKIESSLPLKQGQAGARGRRTVYTLGGGSAQVEVQTFEGAVRIRRTGQAKD